MKTYCSLLAAIIVNLFTLAYGEDVYKDLGPETKDNWFSSSYNRTGVDDYRLQTGGWGDSYRFMIQPTLTDLPKKADIAALWFYCFDGRSFSTTVDMNCWRITSPWNENYGWDLMPSGVYLGWLPAPTKNQWYGINITDLYNGWQSGQYPNFGLMFGPRGINNQFNCFYSTDYSNTYYRPYLFVRYTPDFKLLFPLAGYNPYTTRVVATFDNDRTLGTIKTYNGQIGTEASGKYTYSSTVVGYLRDNKSDFVLPYINYDDEVSTSRKKYIFYDNHSGYDYAPAGVNNMPFVAAADGKLFVATTKTTYDGVNLWREPSYTIPGGTATLQWSSYHTFYIVHINGYSSWYLHANELEPQVKAQIIRSGYANVKKGQTIGYVGNFGTVGAHLHFGLRKDDTLIDPYGNGTRSSVLWELSPP